MRAWITAPGRRTSHLDLAKAAVLPLVGRLVPEEVEGAGLTGEPAEAGPDVVRIADREAAGVHGQGVRARVRGGLVLELHGIVRGIRRCRQVGAADLAGADTAGVEKIEDRVRPPGHFPHPLELGQLVVLDEPIRDEEDGAAAAASLERGHGPLEALEGRLRPRPRLSINLGGDAAGEAFAGSGHGRQPELAKAGGDGPEQAIERVPLSHVLDRLRVPVHLDQHRFMVGHPLGPRLRDTAAFQGLHDGEQIIPVARHAAAPPRPTRRGRHGDPITFTKLGVEEARERSANGGRGGGREVEIVQDDEEHAARLVPGIVCRHREHFVGRGRGRVGRGWRLGHVDRLEFQDRLRDAVLLDDEVLGLQRRDGLSLLVGHHDVHRHPPRLGRESGHLAHGARAAARRQQESHPRGLRVHSALPAQRRTFWTSGSSAREPAPLPRAA